MWASCGRFFELESYQLSAISYQLSAISFQPSAFSHQLSVCHPVFGLWFLLTADR